MIDSITLENWRTHKNSTLKFGKGTNVLVGVIGSGKTSVTDGLCYGLFGTFPALKSNRINGNEVLMRKPTAQDQARVEVCFSANGKNYKVERILKRSGTNEGRLWRDDTLIAGPKPTQVTERIEQELQVSYELFTRAVYSEQNQVDYFLKMNPGERKKKFDELLDLQKYETVRANASALASHFRKSVEAHQKSMEQFDAILKEVDLNALRLKMSETRAQKEEWEKRSLSLKQNVDAETLRVNELEKKWERFQTAQEEVRKKQSRKEMLREQVQKFESQHPEWAGKPLSALQEEKQSLVKKAADALAQQELFRQAESRVQGAAQKVELLSQRRNEVNVSLGPHTFDALRKEKTQLQQQKHDLDIRKQHAQQALQNTLAQTKVLLERMRFLNDEEKAFADLHAACPTCKQEIQVEHKEGLVQAIAQKKEALAAEHQAAEKEHEKLRKEQVGMDTVLKSLDSQLQRLEIVLSKEAEVAKLEHEYASAAQVWQHAQTELEKVGKPPSTQDIEAIRSRVQTLEGAVQNQGWVLELGKLGVELDSLQKELSAFNVSQTSLMEGHKSLSKVQNEWENAKKESAWAEKLVQELHARIQGVEKVVSEQEKIRQKAGRAHHVVEHLGLFSNALQTTQEQLRTSVVEAINAALDEMWPSVYPYHDFRTAQLKIEDSDYSLMLQERSGNWVEAESALSGGERSAAALALRMALAFVLTRQLSWIILDEPTHNLDAKSVNMLSMMLKERLPQLVDQVFVITHAPEIEKAATGSLYVLQREKDDDGITLPQLKPLGGGTPVH